MTPPRWSGAELAERGVAGERFEPGDALLGGRVRAEQAEHAEAALAGERAFAAAEA